MRRPVIVFDSGMGGLTVLAALRRARPDLDILYVADDAGFPYGAMGDGELIERVVSIAGALIGEHDPAGLVIACNSASTLVLGPLRQRFTVPIVGTVPAIKPAASATRSRLVSVLGTPGTVARDYTRALIEEFAAGVHVNLVGASRLAAIAEAAISGEAADPEAIAREIAPAFIARGGERTDIVVLACTHYPLLLPALRAAAPWPVEWLDPAPAIARRAGEVVGPAGGGGECRFIATSGADIASRAAGALAVLIDRNDPPL